MNQMSQTNTSPPSSSFFYSVVKLVDDKFGKHVDKLAESAGEALEIASSTALVNNNSEYPTSAPSQANLPQFSREDIEKEVILRLEQALQNRMHEAEMDKLHCLASKDAEIQDQLSYHTKEKLEWEDLQSNLQQDLFSTKNLTLELSRQLESLTFQHDELVSKLKETHVLELDQANKKLEEVQLHLQRSQDELLVQKQNEQVLLTTTEELSNIRAENEELKQVHLDEVNTIKAQNDELMQARVKNAQDTFVLTMSEEMRKLKEQNDELRQIEIECQTYMSQARQEVNLCRESEQEILGNLETAKMECLNAQSSRDRFRLELDHALKRVAELEKENRALELNLEEATLILESVSKNCLEEKSVLQHRVEEEISMRTNLQHQLEEEISLRTSLQHQLEEVGSLRTSLQHQLEEEGALRTNLQHQLEEEISLRTSLETKHGNDVTVLQDQIVKLTRQDSKVTHEFNSLQEQHSALLKKSQEDLQDSLKVHSSLMFDLEAALRSEQECKAAMLRLEASQKDTTKQNNEILAENQDLSSQLVDANLQLESFQVEMNDKVKELQEKIKEHEVSSLDALAHKQSLETKLASVALELETIQSESATQQEASQKLQQQLTACLEVESMLRMKLQEKDDVILREELKEALNHVSDLEFKLEKEKENCAKSWLDNANLQDWVLDLLREESSLQSKLHETLQYGRNVESELVHIKAAQEADLNVAEQKYELALKHGQDAELKLIDTISQLQALEVKRQALDTFVQESKAQPCLHCQQFFEQVNALSLELQGALLESSCLRQDLFEMQSVASHTGLKLSSLEKQVLDLQSQLVSQQEGRPQESVLCLNGSNDEDLQAELNQEMFDMEADAQEAQAICLLRFNDECQRLEANLEESSQNQLQTIAQLNEVLRIKLELEESLHLKLKALEENQKQEDVFWANKLLSAQEKAETMLEEEREKIRQEMKAKAEVVVSKRVEREKLKLLETMVAPLEQELVQTKLLVETVRTEMKAKAEVVVAKRVERERLRLEQEIALKLEDSLKERDRLLTELGEMKVQIQNALVELKVYQDEAVSREM